MVKRLTKLKTIALVLILSVVASVVIVTGITNLITLVSSQLGVKIGSKGHISYYIVQATARIIGIILCFVLMKVLGIVNRFKWSFHMKYLGFSWLFFIYIILNFNSPAFSTSMIPAMLMMIISYLCVGLYEEMICRGVILSLVLTHWGNSRKQVYFSVIFTSLIFALLHFNNLLRNRSFDDVIIQVGYAFFFGVYFSALLLRTKNNLLWCALLHGIFDVSGHFGDFIIQKGSQALSDNAPSLLTQLTNVGYFMPLLILGLFLLRKVKKVAEDGTVII